MDTSNKNPLYIEDLLAILKNSDTYAVAGYAGTAERVVEHRNLVKLLEQLLAAEKVQP